MSSLPNEWTFKDRFVFKRVDQIEEPLCTNLVREHLGDIDWRSLLLSKEEHENLKTLSISFPRPLIVRMVIYEGNKLAGFSYGWHAEEATFYMAVSLVLPEYRRLGLYTELLRYFIDYTKANGFQVIKSRHKATNNSVIISKLRAGFFITGMELSDTMGTLVHLSYFHNQNRRDLINARSGLTKVTDITRPLFP